MPKTLLIVVSGPPATGKTTLARAVATRYALPLFAKDVFKEMMYDNSPEPIDLALSRFYGKCSIDALRIASSELLAHNISHIIEANFDSALFSPVVRALAERYSFRVLQIQMTCDPGVLEQRFFERAHSAGYHQGNNVPNFMEIMRPSLAAGKSTPLDIGGELLTIDTTSAFSYDPVFEAVERLLPKNQFE